MTNIRYLVSRNKREGWYAEKVKGRHTRYRSWKGLIILMQEKRKPL